MEPRRTRERETNLVQALIGERILESAAGLGATLAVTPTRVIVIRDGAERRPKSGLRAWAHGSVDARLEPPRGGNGRIVLGTGGNPYAAVSIFVPAGSWPVAVRTVEVIRTEARRARRLVAGAAPDARSELRAPKP